MPLIRFTLKRLFLYLSNYSNTCIVIHVTLFVLKAAYTFIAIGVRVYYDYFQLGCALTFASEAKFEIEEKISFRFEAKKKPDFI
jgi:hypothetical protein